MSGEKIGERRALVLGVTGQDGSYLAELLLKKGYEVHGMIRRSATGNTRNIQHLIDDPNIFEKRFFLHKGDLADVNSIYRVIRDSAPMEIYNEADQDHVSWSHAMPAYSYDITGAAVGRILEAIRQIDPEIRYFQPCTSNMFGDPAETPQNENTRFNPTSPYAIAKTMAYYIVRHYRNTYGIFAVNGILFNHESPRRTPEYVTRKITLAAAEIAAGKRDKIALGDLSAEIDWGFAGEYMEVAWMALNHPEPDDYIIATGVTHSVREWLDEAFSVVGLDADKYYVVDERFMRPSKTGRLVGDITKIRSKLGFDPKVDFKKLIRMMVEHDAACLNGGGEDR